MSQRFAAKLLFQYRVESNCPDIMRVTEERIVLIHAEAAREALLTARRRGRKAQTGWIEDDGKRVHVEFVGVLELMHLGIECEEDEVWYEIKTRKQPMERAKTLIPLITNSVHCAE